VRLASLEEGSDSDLYGGKAAQLAAALRAGLPVPRGAALSTELVDALAAGEPAAGAELDRVWSHVEPPLAVRSSAVGEDSETASFAGQHSTYLNITLPAELVWAIQEVWRSAHAESALAYRRRLGLPSTPRIGVVVQELIDAECAGVLFTRNPINGADELVLEASWGLGESVVAGLVTPDRFRIARDGTVLERVAGEKDLAVARAEEGGTREVAVPAERIGAVCLDDRQLSQLVDLAERCSRTFDGALDIEWAAAGDRVWLLQCRAATRTPSLSA
jgi:pyruvate,water dikinase